MQPAFRLGGFPLPRPLLRAAAALAGPAAFLWGVAITDIWHPFPGRVMPVDIAGAGTVSVISALCWVAAVRSERDRREQERDRNMALLIRTLANVTQPGVTSRPTLPLRRVQ